MRLSTIGLAVLLLVFALCLFACSNKGDDDDNDDNGSGGDCMVCGTTGECTAALGAGWVCQGGCCQEAAVDDDQTGDDDAADDDNDSGDDDAGDDDDDNDDDDASPGDVDFTSEDIDLSGPGSRQTSIQVTADGAIHVAYTGCFTDACERDAVYYAKKAGKDADWEIAMVDGTGTETGWFPSLEVADDGSAGLVYCRHANPYLAFGFKPAGGAWSAGVIGEGHAGWWISSTSIGGVLMTSFMHFPVTGTDNGWLQVGKFEGGEWTFSDVDHTGESGFYSAMTATPDGRPVIDYTYVPVYPTGSNKIAEWTGSEWNILQVDSNTIGGDVAVDEDGYFHVAYSKIDSANSNLWDLWYATNAPEGDWTKIALDPGANDEDDTGGFPSIAVDPAGVLHVAYRHFSNDELRYARKIGDTWETYAADAVGQGLYTSIAIDDDGGVHIAYEGGGYIRYSYCATCAAAK
ncbi:MAG: hypothetical protein GX444_07035 [Myxococcales bacterium]|nr:hypothetical protein [Myxococcales bacterium]